VPLESPAMPDDQPIDRRRFFREGLRGLFTNLGQVAGPLQRALTELEQVQRQLGQAVSDAPASPSARPPQRPAASPGSAAGTGGGGAAAGERILRPPGAKPDDEDFTTTCSTSGNCVNACPVQAIQLDPGRAGGAAFVVAEHQPCVLCDGLMCMYNCPSGAITAVPIGLVDMGTATWREDRCVRPDGTDCTMCVDRCPIGPRAIELLAGKVVVHRDGCTGCGVCEHACPTTPKSILVIPKARRDADEAEAGDGEAGEAAPDDG
jgi:ferredoxin-type protein NapG